MEWFYWLDTSAVNIKRSRLDGTGLVQTVATSTDLTRTARDLAVDSNNQYVYWADDGHNEIRRKLADGTGAVQTLVNSGVTAPYGIALDDQYVYWADRTLNTIKQVRQDGTGTVATLADSTDGVSRPWALVIASYGLHLYWHNQGDSTIREVANYGMNTVTTLASGGNGFRLERPSREPLRFPCLLGGKRGREIGPNQRRSHRRHACDQHHGHARINPAGRGGQPRWKVCLLG